MNCTVCGAPEEHFTGESCVNHLKSKLDGLQLQLDSWREAYRKLTAGDHAEVRLDTDGAIDEVVGSGVFHMEQMDTNRWFFDLAGCRFNINGKKVTLTPIEVDTWAEEQKRIAVEKRRDLFSELKEGLESIPVERLCPNCGRSGDDCCLNER